MQSYVRSLMPATVSCPAVSETLRVLGVLTGLGLAGIPLGALALRRLPGGGAGLGRVLALLIVTWLIWMAGSLGVPNGLALTIAAVVVVAGLAAVAHLVTRRDEDRARKRLTVGAEVVFLVTFLGAALFIAYSPDVWNTEKPMDMAFMTATLASDQIPPHDPWMAGEDLNYYYLGHLAAALLIRLTDVEPSAGYNLALAAVFALSASAAFGVGAALAAASGARRPTLAGLVSAFALVALGTPRGGSRALEHEGPTPAFDWFGPSRVIPDTINEFPFFSFLLGDLHAHVLAIPFTLLVVALAVQVALYGPRSFLVTALAVGFLYGVNSWSWPLGVLLVALATVVWVRREEARPGAWKTPVVWAAGVVLTGALLMAPFLLSFDPNAKGLGYVKEREGFGDFMTQHAVIYGALAWLFAALYVCRFLLTRHKLRLLVFGGSALAVGLPLLAGADLAGAGTLLALTAVAVHALLDRRLEASRRILWALAAAALACLVIPEVVYVRDEFDGGPLFRMNTVFKLGYQAWILLAVAAGVVLVRDREWIGWGRWPYRLVALGLVALSCAYTVVGSLARKNDFAGPATLEGRRWLARSAPGDLGAIDWLRDNAPGDAVVLEAVGDDYSAFGHARIATFTGRPTVMGWAGHELQWSHDPSGRREAVQALYTAPDGAAAKPVLERYEVRYVVVGPIERTDYGEAGVAKWEQLGKKVFERDSTTVYDLGPRPEAPRDPPRGPPIIG